MCQELFREIVYLYLFLFDSIYINVYQYYIKCIDLKLAWVMHLIPRMDEARSQDRRNGRKGRRME